MQTAELDLSVPEEKLNWSIEGSICWDVLMNTQRIYRVLLPFKKPEIIYLALQRLRYYDFSSMDPAAYEASWYGTRVHVGTLNCCMVC